MSHPIALTLDDDLRRSRATVFFRPILVIPHLIWLVLWSLVAYVALILSWFATLFVGRTPGGLHRFIAQYQRYTTHVTGYLSFLANPYPGFLGNRAYPADLVVAPPERQNRWKTAFRLLLVIPANLMVLALSYALLAAAVFAWFACLVTGSMPLGLRNMTTWFVRFRTQTNGYLWLLTDRYPNFSPDLLE